MEVSIDSSGKPLNQRGYRTRTNIAPINEVLAAGHQRFLVETHQPVARSMCGSGTLLLKQPCRPVISLHKSTVTVAFEKWNDYDADLFHHP